MTWDEEIEKKIREDRQKFEAIIDDIKSTNFYDLWYKAKALSALKRHDDALIEFDNAIRVGIKDKDSLLLIKKHRAECADHLGLRPTEIEDKDPLNEFEDPSIAGFHVNIGIKLARDNRHEEALAEFDEAINYDPTDFSAHFEKGKSLATLEKYEEALAEFDNALESNGERNSVTSEILLWKGKSLVALGELVDALESFQKAIEEGSFEDGLEETYLFEGIAFADLGFYESAVDAFDVLINKDEINEKVLVKALRYKGEVLLNLGKNKEAAISLLKAIDLLLDEQNKEESGSI